eukprot:18405-Heterococcus_DN1.PRE.1
MSAARGKLNDVAVPQCVMRVYTSCYTEWTALTKCHENDSAAQWYCNTLYLNYTLRCLLLSGCVSASLLAQDVQFTPTKTKKNKRHASAQQHEGLRSCVLYNGVCLTSNLNDCISITVCHTVQGIKTDVSQRAKLETVAPLRCVRHHAVAAVMPTSSASLHFFSSVVRD